MILQLMVLLHYPSAILPYYPFCTITLSFLYNYILYPFCIIIHYPFCIVTLSFLYNYTILSLYLLAYSPRSLSFLLCISLVLILLCLILLPIHKSTLHLNVCWSSATPWWRMNLMYYCVINICLFYAFTSKSKNTTKQWTMK